MPESFALDQFTASRIIVGGPDPVNSSLTVAYDVSDVTGSFRKTKTKQLALTLAQQTAVNGLWTAAINAAKAQEGIP